MAEEDENKPQEEANTPQKPLQVMIFRVGEQNYCMPVISIREICRPTKLTAIPHAPPYVLGATNLRGEIPVIIDLSLILGVSAQKDNKRRVVIMLEHDDLLTGLVVDEVIRMKEVDMATATSVETGEFLKGTLIVDDTIVGILDTDAIVRLIREQG